MRINCSNTTRALIRWKVDRRTDRRLSQLDHVENDRTSLVSDVKLNCVDWGYVQSTKQRAGWIPNTEQETDHPDIITLTLPAQGSFIVSNTFHSVYQLKEIIHPHRKYHVVCFLWGNSPASEFYMPTFRNTLFHLHRQVGMKNSSYLPAYEDGKECSETSAYNHFKY